MLEAHLKRRPLTLVAFITLMFTLVACQSDPPSAKTSTPPVIKSAQPQLVKIDPAKTPERVVEHLDGMDRLLRSALEVLQLDGNRTTCKELGGELKVYVDLVEGDFKAAAKQKISDDVRGKIEAKSKRLSTLVVRCLSGSQKTRDTITRLSKLTKPLVAPPNP